MDVVLADDSDVSRRMLAATLERCGHRVIAVADGEAAWAAFEQRRPPMLILDWQMPGIAMSGVATPSRIVALTARSTASASSARPREWRSSSAALRMVPIGFAIPWPTIVGAEP